MNTPTIQEEKPKVTRGITKEYFLSGQRFLVYNDTNMGRFYLSLNNGKAEDSGLFVDEYYSPYKYAGCNISKVTDSGFYYYGSFLGNRVTGKVLFADCIPIEPLPKT